MSGRSRSAARAVTAALAAAGLVLSWPAAAAQGATTYDASVLAEAWYRASATTLPPVDGCGLPVVGCAPLPVAPPTVNPYPAGTLHVGVAGAREEARTYLTLVSASVPFDETVVGGTLLLPVATDPQAGTVAAETAAMRACLVRDPVRDGVEAGLGGAPAADCTIASPAAFVAGEGATGPSFTVDLAPFAQELATGQLSLALVPAEPPGTAWHVAFSRRDREAEGARPITAKLRTAQEELPEAPDVVVDEDVAVDVTPPAQEGGFGFDVTPGLEPVPVAPAQLPDAAPVVAAEVPAVSLPEVGTLPVAARSSSYKYPGVFLLPLVLLGGVGWVARTLTRDLRPAVV